MALESYDFLVSEIRVSLDKREEIDKLMLEEDLSETKRAIFLLTKGQQRQKQAVYCNLAQILINGFDQLFHIVIADLMEQNDENIIEAGKALRNINCHASSLLPLALHFLQLFNLKFSEVWVPVFGNLLTQINYQEYKDFIEKIILTLSQPKQPEVGRITGSLMIIELINYLEDKIQGPVLDRVRLLCNDIDPEVRGLIAGDVFNALIQKLNPTLIHQYLEDKILPLLYDSSPYVKMAMIKTVFQNFYKLVQNNLINANSVLKDCLTTQNEDVLSSSLQFCGDALLALKDNFDLELKQRFVNQFVKFAEHQNDEIRYYYLYNLPGVMILCKDLQLCYQLFSPYCKIIDEDNQKNKEFACKILHELIKVFDYSFISTQIFFIVTNILNSGEIKLIINIHFDKIFLASYQNGNLISLDKLQNLYKQIFKDFSKLYQQCILNIQLNQQYLEQVKSFVLIVKPKLFEKYYLPILYQKQSNRENDKLSMEILALFFSECQNYDLQQRIKDMMQLLYSKGNCNKKIKYLYFVSSLPNLISKKYFISLNFHQITLLQKDNIKDVLIQLIKIYPKINHYLLDHNEYKNLKQLKGITLQNLVQDTIKQIEQTYKVIDEHQQQKFQEIENKVYQEHLNNLKQMKNYDTSLSYDYNTIQKKRPAPKLISLSAKQEKSASQIRVKIKDQSGSPQSRSSDRPIKQMVSKKIDTTKFKSRPSGFNKF